MMDANQQQGSSREEQLDQIDPESIPVGRHEQLILAHWVIDENIRRN